MTEFNEKDDKIVANNWFDAKEALAELDALKFAVASLVVTAGSEGSCEHENASNAYRGIRARIDYLHDSLRRLLH